MPGGWKGEMLGVCEAYMPGGILVITSIDLILNLLFCVPHRTNHMQPMWILIPKPHCQQVIATNQLICQLVGKPKGNSIFPTPSVRVICIVATQCISYINRNITGTETAIQGSVCIRLRSVYQSFPGHVATTISNGRTP